MKKFFKKYIFEPRIAFIVFILFIIGYLVFLDEEKAFTNNFLRFGPAKKGETPAKYLGMKLNTWKKVIIVYVIGFFTSLLTTYYNTVSYDFIHSFIWNPAYTKEIPLSKLWTTIIVVIEPLLYWILQILNFFVNLTLELQYLIPKFIGDIVVAVPFSLFKVSQKIYKK